MHLLSNLDTGLKYNTQKTSLLDCMGMSLYCRGLEKRGGRLLLGSHVNQVMVEDGRACGVTLRGGGTIRARKVIEHAHTRILNVLN